MAIYFIRTNGEERILVSFIRFAEPLNGSDTLAFSDLLCYFPFLRYNELTVVSFSFPHIGKALCTVCCKLVSFMPSVLG